VVSRGMVDHEAASPLFSTRKIIPAGTAPAAAVEFAVFIEKPPARSSAIPPWRQSLPFKGAPPPIFRELVSARNSRLLNELKKLSERAQPSLKPARSQRTQPVESRESQHPRGGKTIHAP